jgi:hypothetical protein
MYTMRTLLGLALILSVATAEAQEFTIPASKVVELQGDPQLQPLSEPVTDAAIRESIDRGVQYLVAKQNANGSWGSPTRTKGLNIYAPVPGAHLAFRTGTTALALSALIECGEPDDPAVQAAIDRGEAWLLLHLPELRRANPTAIYNVWGHAYGIEALVRMHERRPYDAARQRQIRTLIEDQIQRLSRYEFALGGWGYYDFDVGTQMPAGDPTSFTTATVLIAFRDAERIGVSIPERLVQRGAKVIHLSQKPDLTYLYSLSFGMQTRPMYSINRAGGSLGRSQVCNLALKEWGDTAITEEVIRHWIDRLVVRNGWLDIGRKRPVPHEAWFAVAGYFYYYGHYYAARSLELLSDADRPLRAEHLAHLMIEHQDGDGSWWDFPFYDYHQPYGTGLALMTLKRCLQTEGVGPMSPVAGAYAR